MSGHQVQHCARKGKLQCRRQNMHARSSLHPVLVFLSSYLSKLNLYVVQSLQPALLDGKEERERKKCNKKTRISVKKTEKMQQEVENQCISSILCRTHVKV